MKIGDFLQGRLVERQAVTRYIERHSEEFEGHISKIGREIVLDDVAIQILDKQYPPPKPVEVINGVDPKAYEKLDKECQEWHKKYTAALEEMIPLKAENERLIAEKESQIKLIQMKNELDKQEAVQKAVQSKEDELILKHQAEERKLKEEFEQKLKTEQERKLTFKERFFGKKQS